MPECGVPEYELCQQVETKVFLNERLGWVVGLLDNSFICSELLPGVLGSVLGEELLQEGSLVLGDLGRGGQEVVGGKLMILGLHSIVYNYLYVWLSIDIIYYSLLILSIIYYPLSIIHYSLSIYCLCIATY